MSTAVQDSNMRAGRSDSGRRIAVVGLLGLILLLVIGAALMLSTQQSRLTKATEQRETAEQTLSQRQETVEVAQREQLRNAMGADPQRLDDDEAVIDSLARAAGTWDSGPSYAQARADLIERTGLSEDDRFFTDFMPPAASNVDGTGERTYYIDTMGISSQTTDTQIGLDAVTADEYSYTVLMETTISSEAVDSSSPEGSDSSTGRMLLQVSIDGQGEITALDGAAAGASTRR